MGFFGIGIYEPKYSQNIGTLWRSAYLLGASFIFLVKGKHKRLPSDTQKTWRQIPCYEWGEMQLPVDSVLVGVETIDACPTAIDLPEFKHPKRAVYILGNEKSGIPKEMLEKCDQCVTVPSARGHSYNVSMAGTLIMYDRYVKLWL